MKGLTYFAAMAVLAAALIFAQSATPSSDTGKPTAQSQNDVTHTVALNQNSGHSGASKPQRGPSPDQQAIPLSNPSSAPPQPYVDQTPAVRSVATHTPDPGTCMNPAALQTAEDGSQPRLSPHCD